MKLSAALLCLAFCLVSASASRSFNRLPHSGKHLLQDSGNTAAAPASEPMEAAAGSQGTAEGVNVAVPAANVNITVPNIPVDNVTSATVPAAEGTTTIIGTPAGNINVTVPATGNTTGAANASAEVPTKFANMSEAAGFFDYLSVLNAALDASGFVANITNDTAWTILAPTNTAFIDRLATLGLTPQQLLLPENNATLNEVLALHIIPSGPVLSSQLEDGMNVTTALPGNNLTVNLTAANGNVTFAAENNSAIVIVPDISAGASVIHVINDILLPAGMMPENTTASSTGLRGSTAAGNASSVASDMLGAPVVTVPSSGALPGAAAAPAVEPVSPVVGSAEEIGVNTTTPTAAAVNNTAAP